MKQHFKWDFVSFFRYTLKISLKSETFIIIIIIIIIIIYNVSVSFHSGFSEALMVFVFILTLSLSVSGISRALTNGSERPLGSMGIKFLPWRTANR